MKIEEENKALVREAFEQVWNLRHFEKIPEFYSQEYIADYPQMGGHREGHDGIKELVERAWSACADYNEELHELIAEGEYVAARLTISGTHRGDVDGFAATGKRFETEEILMLKVQEGKIVWQRGVIDLRPWLHQ